MFECVIPIVDQCEIEGNIRKLGYLRFSESPSSDPFTDTLPSGNTFAHGPSDVDEAPTNTSASRTNITPANSDKTEKYDSERT